MERAEAIRLGLKKYATGRPCKHGHNVERYTESGACVSCVKNLVTISATSSAATRARIELETTQIYLFSQKSGYPAIKAVIDAALAARCPELPPEVVNPYPFKGKQVSNFTYQIRVRVPIADADSILQMGKILLEPEIVNPKPRPLDAS